MPVSEDYPVTSDVPACLTPTYKLATPKSQHKASLEVRDPAKEYINSDFGDSLQVNSKKLKPNNYGSVDYSVDGFNSLSAAPSSFSMLSPQFLSPQNQAIFFSATDNLTPKLSERQPNQNIKEPDSSQAQDLFKGPIKTQQGLESFMYHSPSALSTKDIFDFNIKPVEFKVNDFDLGEYEDAAQLNPMSAFQSRSNVEVTPEKQTDPIKNEGLANEDSSQSTLNGNSLQSWQIFKQMTRYNELVDEGASTEEQTGTFNGDILEQAALVEYSQPLPNPNNGTMSIPEESQIATLPNELITGPNALAEWEEFKRSKDIKHESQEPSTIAISDMLPDDDTTHLAKMWSRFKQKTGYCSESAETPAETETLLENLFTPTTYAFQNPATLSARATPLMPNHVSSPICVTAKTHLTPLPATIVIEHPHSQAGPNCGSHFTDPPKPQYEASLIDGFTRPTPIEGPNDEMIGSAAAPRSLSPSSPLAQKAYADLPVTPLLPSPRLSQLAGCQVFLKMEGLQKGGTHKIRGLLRWVADMVNLYGSDLHFIVGALPNMSIACAAAVAHYNQHNPTSCVTLSAVTPACSPPRFSQLLHTHGAKCIRFGQTWGQAKSHARILVEKNQAQSIASLVMPPEDLVSGLTSIGQEIKQQIRPHLNNTHIDAILCPVGSGALLASLAHEFNQRTSVVGVETTSTDLFHTCLVQKKMVFRPPKSACDSLSLSDPSLCYKAIEAAKTCPVIPVVVSEAMAANASLQFSEDHNVLIEAASGAALSPIYHELISGLIPDLQPTSTIVVVITGGNLASLSDFARFAKHHSHPLIQAKSQDLFFLSLTPPSLISEEENLPSSPAPDLPTNSS